MSRASEERRPLLIFVLLWNHRTNLIASAPGAGDGWWVLLALEVMTSFANTSAANRYILRIKPIRWTPSPMNCSVVMTPHKRSNAFQVVQVVKSLLLDPLSNTLRITNCIFFASYCGLLKPRLEPHWASRSQACMAPDARSVRIRAVPLRRMKHGWVVMSPN